jgi:hypothetical protein
MMIYEILHITAFFNIKFAFQMHEDQGGVKLFILIFKTPENATGSKESQAFEST